MRDRFERGRLDLTYAHVTAAITSHPERHRHAVCFRRWALKRSAHDPGSFFDITACGASDLQVDVAISSVHQDKPAAWEGKEGLDLIAGSICAHEHGLSEAGELPRQR